MKKGREVSKGIEMILATCNEFSSASKVEHIEVITALSMGFNKG